MFAEEVVERPALLDEGFAILVALGGELDEEGAAAVGFSFGKQTFLNHGFYGAMDNGAVETEQRGDLILVERGATAERGQDEAARLRTAGFLFEAFADGKVSGREIEDHGILQNFVRDERSIYDEVSGHRN